MATMNTNAATATTTTVTPVAAFAAAAAAGPDHVSDSDADVQQNNKTKARLPKKPTNRKCCFNEPGGPWPRYVDQFAYDHNVADSYPAISFSRQPPVQT